MMTPVQIETLLQIYYKPDWRPDSPVSPAVVQAIEDPIEIEVWELYRKRPVKNNLQESAYFHTKTFERVYAAHD